MKKLILLSCVLLSFTTTYAQQFHMNGRFCNSTPNVNAGIDSAAFIFTNVGYNYYINANTNPSSHGEYEIINGSMSDTIVFYEDSLGVCSNNGTGAVVKMEIDKTTTPFYSIILSQTANSLANCPSHSLKMSGDFIASNGGIIYGWAASVKDTKTDIGLQAYNYGNQLVIKSRYNEKVYVSVTNVNGQKVMKTQDAYLTQGEKATFELSSLSAGIYFVLIQSEHGKTAIKVGL